MAMSNNLTNPTSREMALNALRIDFRSTIRDRNYRLLVSVPDAISGS
jgi:hypothetical protein